MENVIIFGASTPGIEFYEAFDGKLVNVVAFADNDIRKQGLSIYDCPIISAEHAVVKQLRIIICGFFKDEIAEQLKNDYKYSNYIKYSPSTSDLQSFFMALAVSDSLFEGSKIKQFRYQGKDVRFFLPEYTSDYIQQIIWSTGKFYEGSMLEDIQNRLADFEGATAVDVGCNIGNHTVYMSMFCNVKKVYSFEPHAVCHQSFNKTIELNKLEDRVELYKIALGQSKTAKASVIDYMGDHGSAKMCLNETGGVEVDLLDDVLLDKLTSLDLLKIDVEGMELDVLRGARGAISKYRPIIYVEAAEFNSFVNIHKWLAPMGYIYAKRFNSTPTYLFIPRR